MSTGTNDDAEAAGTAAVTPGEAPVSADAQKAGAARTAALPSEDSKPDAVQVMAEGLNYLAGKDDKAS